MAVVDRAEAVQLQRSDQQHQSVFVRLYAKILGAVGKALAIKETGDRIGRSGDRCPSLAFDPAFGLMLQVDVAAPTEQDQRDVQRQRNRSDLHARPQYDFGLSELAEEGRAVAN